MPYFLKEKSPILALFFLALIVRLWGINHGFPFLYHPDEPTVVRTALGLRFGDLNPHHFDWPHLQINLAFIVFGLFIKMRAVLRLLELENFTSGLLPILWDDPTVFYLIGRLMAAFMGALTIVFLYLAGKKLYSKAVGIIAALFLTFNLVHVSESHVATIDVPMVMWLTLSLLFCIYILKEGELRYYLLAGLFAGMATSTKYNGALSVVTIFIAFLGFTLRELSGVKEKKGVIVFKNIMYLSLAAVSSLLGFFLGTPYALLDWKTFTYTGGPKGAFWQFYHVGGREVRSDILIRLQKHLLGTLNSAQGSPLNFLSILGTFYLIFKGKSEGILLVTFPLLYFFYVGNFSYAPEHYFLPLYPYTSLIAAKLVSDVIYFLNKALKLYGLKIVFITIFILGIFLMIPLKETVKADLVLARKDTRTQAYEWIEENLPDFSGIALGGDYEPILREKEDENDEEKGYRLVWLHALLKGEDLSPRVEFYFKKENIRYAILGSFNFDKEKYPRWDSDEPDFWAWVIDNGKLLEEFKPGYYPGPTVLIYEIEW